jgi:outer membrane protein insertion porin family
MKVLSQWLLSLSLFLPINAFSEVVILSNYPLPKNNFESLVSEENYQTIVEILKSLDEVKNVTVEEKDGQITIKVERYPILKSIKIKGNVAVWKDEILNYLTLYEGVPLKEIDPKSLEDKLKELYREKGYIEAKTKVNIQIDELGFASIEIEVKEGDVFFIGGGVYKGSSLDPSFLDERLGIIKGRIAKEGELSRKVFDLQDIYLSLGFWDSFAYYEGLQKAKMEKPFWRVLLPTDPSIERRPLRLVGALAEGIKNLFSHPISTLKAISGKGKLAYPVFYVYEGKRYQAFFEGNSFFSPQELLKISGLPQKGIDIFSLEEAKESIVNAYHSKGFFDVEVEYKQEGETIIFSIKEGQRYNAIVNGQTLPYDEEELKKELEKMIEQLRAEGYILAEGEIKTNIDKDKKLANVSFAINKGKKQILKTINYVGNNEDIAKIFRDVNKKLPAVYDSALIEQLNLRIEKYLKGNGYMEGSFEAEVMLEEGKDVINYIYTYKVSEGPRYKAGLDLYYGTKITSDRELSYMTVREEFYSEKTLDETLYNFTSSNLFIGVKIDTFIDTDKKQVHRLIKLQEDKRGFYDLGVGYNSQEGLILDLTLGLKNLFGIGLSSILNYKRSEKRETYSLNFEDHFLFTRKLWFKSNVFKDYQKHRVYTLDTQGFALSVGYRITRYTSFGPFFSISDNRYLGTSARLNKYGLFLLREYKDDIFNPRRVHYDSLNLLKASGDLNYTKVELNTFYFVPITTNLNLSFKVSGGSAWGSVPIFDRYFLGGLTNLRGYSYEEVGSPTGGKSYVFGRMELEVPLKGSFVFVPFYDVGGVGESSNRFPRDIKHSFGFGGGVKTPVGPIRLDLAFPGERDFLKKFKLYLSVGYIY